MKTKYFALINASCHETGFSPKSLSAECKVTVCLIIQINASFLEVKIEQTIKIFIKYLIWKKGQMHNLNCFFTQK